MPRFFRRLAEGVFDLDDLARRTDELARFIAAAREAYGIEKPVAVGFSNGANIAGALLLTRPDVLAGAVLLRATLPFVPEQVPVLAGVPVLILSGAMDPMVSADKREQLNQLLKSAGADVTHEVVPAGHNLTAQDLAAAEAWLARHG
jgi:phospholipase/carboxylesterase